MLSRMGRTRNILNRADTPHWRLRIETTTRKARNFLTDEVIRDSPLVIGDHAPTSGASQQTSYALSRVRCRHPNECSQLPQSEWTDLDGHRSGQGYPGCRPTLGPIYANQSRKVEQLSLEGSFAAAPEHLTRRSNLRNQRDVRWKTQRTRAVRRASKNVSAMSSRAVNRKRPGSRFTAEAWAESGAKGSGAQTRLISMAL